MALITGLLLAVFAAYGVGWYAGFFEGNMPLLLLITVVVTGLYWILDRIFFLPKRKKLFVNWRANQPQSTAAQTAQERKALRKEEAEVKAQLMQRPWWLDWTAGVFPILLVVFLIRSFVFEPFKIPSGSMLPTLYVGDLILVNKFEYGLRLPVWNTQLTQGHEPQRGDVVVFRYPPNPKLDYIKRIVGLPGDVVSYQNKVLSVNGVAYTKQPLPDFFDNDASVYALQFQEDNGPDGKKSHLILNVPQRPSFISSPGAFPFRENCDYDQAGVTCTVPKGHFFAMGDNRDNSLDSRFWGFVPKENIVGKAEYIWMNFSHLERIGRTVE